MNSLWQSILLGALQGITEFLPISSSGHLVLAQNFLTGFKSSGLVFDVVLHAGTLLAVLLYYRNDLVWLLKGSMGNLEKDDNNSAKIWVQMLILGTIPAAVIGVFAEEKLEKLFKSPVNTSLFLCFTGCILLFGEFIHRKMQTEKDDLSQPYFHSFLIGCAQAMALIPGVSRSGSTMAAGLAVGWTRKKAARFSFLLMIPAVSGAVVLKLPELPALLKSGDVKILDLASGFLTAFVFGYLSIIVLLKLIQKYSFKPFGIYCLVVGIMFFVIQVL